MEIGAAMFAIGPAMNITLQRVQIDPNFTIGHLYVHGFECWTCEDAVRPEKIAGITAIPAGLYTIRRTMSARFKRMLPLLIDVPGYTGVRIHPGNKAWDTEGCVLPGLDRRPDGVGRSVLAFNQLDALIEAAEQQGEEILIEIR